MNRAEGIVELNVEINVAHMPKKSFVAAQREIFGNLTPKSDFSPFCRESGRVWSKLQTPRTGRNKNRATLRRYDQIITQIITPPVQCVT